MLQQQRRLRARRLPSRLSRCAQVQVEGTCRLQDTAFGAGVLARRFAVIKCPAEYKLEKSSRDEMLLLSRCGTLCIMSANVVASTQKPLNSKRPILCAVSLPSRSARHAAICRVKDSRGCTSGWGGDLCGRSFAESRWLLALSVLLWQCCCLEGRRWRL